MLTLDAPKSRRRSLDSWVPPTLPRVGRHPYDFTQLTRGQALVADVLGTPERSANSIEAAMGWVRPRSGDADGTWNARIIDRARSAEQPLSDARLDCLQERFPSIRVTRNLPLWPLLRRGELAPEIAGRATKFLDAPSFWILHAPVHPWVTNIREISFERDLHQITDEDLARLTLLGTLNGLTALLLLLYEAQVRRPNRDEALRVAKRIPAALALYGCTSRVCERVAYLVFARLRQLYLDRIEVDGTKLDLAAYDLATAAMHAGEWNGTDLPSDRMRAGAKKPNAPIPEERTTWLNHWLAPTQSISASTDSVRRWREGCGPGARLMRMEKNFFPLCSRAMGVLKATLDKYW